MEPLRVVLWAPLPPPQGGVSRWAERFLQAASGVGLDPVVVNIAPPSTAQSEQSRLRLDKSLAAARTLLALDQALRQHRPAVAHLTTTLFWATAREAAAIALCRAHGVKTVLHLHGSNQMIAWREGLDPVRRRGLDAVLRSASAVLVLSEEMQVYLQRQLPGLRVDRIGNMVELDTPAGSMVLPPRTQRFRVLFVGMCSPLKGVPELCEAVLGLPDVELVLVGGPGAALDATQEARMQRAIADLRLTGRLVECGALSSEAVMQAYRESDVLALPTHREGLPNVLLEAMAAGLPCVATPVGAIPEVLGGHSPGPAPRGWIVPVGDPAALRDALELLRHDDGLRAKLGAAAREHVAAHYGIDVVMRAYVQLYRGLAA